MIGERKWVLDGGTEVYLTHESRKGRPMVAIQDGGYSHMAELNEVTIGANDLAELGAILLAIAVDRNEQ